MDSDRLKFRVKSTEINWNRAEIELNRPKSSEIPVIWNGANLIQAGFKLDSSWIRVELTESPIKSNELNRNQLKSSGSEAELESN